MEGSNAAEKEGTMKRMSGFGGHNGNSLKTFQNSKSDVQVCGVQELERLKRQAEALKRDVELLQAIRGRNMAREKELMASMKDYSEYIRLVALVKEETAKRVSQYNRTPGFLLCYMQLCSMHVSGCLKQGLQNNKIHKTISGSVNL